MTSSFSPYKNYFLFQSTAGNSADPDQVSLILPRATSILLCLKMLISSNFTTTPLSRASVDVSTTPSLKMVPPLLSFLDPVMKAFKPNRTSALLM